MLAHISKGPMLACFPSRHNKPNSIEITEALQPKEQLTLQASTLPKVDQPMCS
jgi:hypothetical protein